jgi:hypothetical protein
MIFIPDSLESPLLTTKRSPLHWEFEYPSMRPIHTSSLLEEPRGSGMLRDARITSLQYGEAGAHGCLQDITPLRTGRATKPQCVEGTL